jgi:hypothetical protein
MISFPPGFSHAHLAIQPRGHTGSAWEKIDEALLPRSSGTSAFLLIIFSLQLRNPTLTTTGFGFWKFAGMGHVFRPEQIIECFLSDPALLGYEILDASASFKRFLSEATERSWLPVAETDLILWIEICYPTDE